MRQVTAAALSRRIYHSMVRGSRNVAGGVAGGTNRFYADTKLVQHLDVAVTVEIRSRASPRRATGGDEVMLHERHAMGAVAVADVSFHGPQLGVVVRDRDDQ